MSYAWYLAGIAWFAGLLVVNSAESAEVELLCDPHFHRGFVLLEPQIGKRVVRAEVRGIDPTGKPAWDLAQWSSRFPGLPSAAEVLPGGAVRYANPGKTVVIGPEGSSQADLSLAVQGSAEYGGKARRDGEPWVHLLVGQEISRPPSLGDLTACRLRVAARLKKSQLTKTEDYSPSRHAAQLQVFLTVANRKAGTPGFGQYLWFGVPIYDDRYRLPPAFHAQDRGDTKMFIYTCAAESFTRESLHDGRWVTLQKDLLPLFHQALECAWSRGFLPGSREPADYQITGAFVGWEVPGIFDVDLQLRDLSLMAVTK